MEWESDSPCHSHTDPGQGRRSPGRHSTESWTWGIVEQAQGEGCCWVQRDRPSRCDEGDCGGKCLWRKARQPRKQGNTAESRVGGKAITTAYFSPHTSIGSWTIERLAHQMPESLNYRVGSHPGCPFKCPIQSSTPARGGLLCAWCTKQQRRTPGKGTL